MNLPTQQQLLIPLLGVVKDLGGRAPTKAICDRLAEKLEIGGDDRQATVDMPSAAGINVWDRHVRWTQQLAKAHGLICHQDKYWELTESGDSGLKNARPGVVVTVFESAEGVAMWAEAQAAVDVIQDGSIAAIITSPPYPLIRKKDYENQMPEREHVEWLGRFFASAKPKLAHNGSLILNLGPVWRPGQAAMSLYAERLLLQLCDQAGYHLAQKLYWHNPSKMPAPAEWVTVRRIRVTPAIEEVFWLSKSMASVRGGLHAPKADNRNVLRAYSDRMRNLLAGGGETGRNRPSGHVLAAGAFGHDNGGSIPHNLITAANTSSNDAYQRYCHEKGLPAHPARFPAELPEFFIKLLTDPGDVIWDPFGGSLQTAASAQRLGRRFITNEKSLAYLEGGVGGRLGASLSLTY